MQSMEGIKNIIFDLGGVILDIDMQKAFNRFAELGFHDAPQLVSHYQSSGFMHDLEVGKATPQQFYDGVRQRAGKNISNDEIKEAWNSLLLNYDSERINLLLQLKQKYRLFLLSNTNIIHYQNYANRVPGAENLNSLFEKAFYSFEIGVSKPSAAAFQIVLVRQGLKAEETLYLDDSPANIHTAQLLGMKAKLVENGRDWLKWLS
jgi:putative hydrolase of the HAD superfamily